MRIDIHQASPNSLRWLSSPPNDEELIIPQASRLVRYQDKLQACQFGLYEGLYSMGDNVDGGDDAINDMFDKKTSMLKNLHLHSS